jgi:hypothetical protein
VTAFAGNTHLQRWEGTMNEDAAVLVPSNLAAGVTEGNDDGSPRVSEQTFWMLQHCDDRDPSSIPHLSKRIRLSVPIDVAYSSVSI